MKRRKLRALWAILIMAIATLLISSQTVLVSAKNGAAPARGGQKSERGQRSDHAQRSDEGQLVDQGQKDVHDKLPPPYNPYPPGILPSDLNSEIARVLREIDGIEAEALAQLRALTPPTLTNQPPLLAHTGQRLNVLVGKALNFDRNISPFKDRACAFCHMPYAGFSGPIPSVNLTMVAYPASYPYRAGKRTAQRYTYAPSFPVLNYNETQQAFFGGNFWDSRATGYLLGSPDANQAQGPPVDTQEHALPDTACVAFRLQSAVYKSFFIELWGDDLNAIKFPHNAEEICETPGGASTFGTDTMPIKLSSTDRAIANHVYDHWGQSLDQYEASPDVSAFSSKFDAFLHDPTNNPLSADEMAGYNLFRGKANCNSCHLDGRSTAPTPPPPQGSAPNSMDTGAAASTAPLFTCFGSANLGLPLNPRNAFYYQTTPDFFGFTANPFGFGYRDLGLGTFLRSGFGTWASPNDDWTPFAPASDGLMQTSSARNVAMTPPQCPTTEAPGPYFQKEFFHNGYIKSLKQLVHFYNTRDVYPFPTITSGHCPAGTTEKVNCWPMAEVKNNEDMTLGMLGLTDTEEDQIVAFLQTLTDGYTRPFPDSGAYTGVCKTGGTAATQGNEFLIPTPTLPPCPAAICGLAPLPTMPIP
ncbi:MAG TPA: cytochrome c peroxidase [Candidatus Limnocylindrales bacterium]|nr:cytochrome c peroxidase [Candidatus Limnocylindrales bacterium]